MLKGCAEDDDELAVREGGALGAFGPSRPQVSMAMLRRRWCLRARMRGALGVDDVGCGAVSSAVRFREGEERDMVAPSGWSRGRIADYVCWVTRNRGHELEVGCALMILSVVGIHVVSSISVAMQTVNASAQVEVT